MAVCVISVVVYGNFLFESPSVARIFTPGGERGTHPGPTFVSYLGARKIRPLLLARVLVSIVSDVATVTFMRPHDGHLGVRFDVGLIFQFHYS
jgi:hypothetical protein